MELNTAAAVIKYVSKLELDSSELYEEWSKRHEEVRDFFEKLSKENKKNEQKIKRTYYSVVSDALETAFCFKGFQSDLKIPKSRQGDTVSEILEAAIRVENGIKAFYMEAADLSKCLLADVPREMQKLANARENRIRELMAMSQPEKIAEDT
jgi:rubrerythrin